MNRHLLHIKEVSDLYGIPVPTLRHWEEAGLITSTRAENNYRLFHLSGTLIELGDTVFYRNAEIPFGTIKQMKTMKSEALKETLSSARDTLGEKLLNLKAEIARLEKKLAMIGEIEQCTDELTETDIPFRRVIEFDYKNKEHFRRYLADPSVFISISKMGTDMSEDVNGLAVEDGYPGKVIFERDPNDRYLMAYCKNPLHKYSYDYLGGLKQKLSEMGAVPMQYILQFLVNMVDEDGNSADYYKVWFKIT